MARRPHAPRTCAVHEHEHEHEQEHEHEHEQEREHEHEHEHEHEQEREHEHGRLGRHELIRAGLMRWHATHARAMPWRTEPRDPYAVWVSEVMLQQTRVVSAAPYFERFLERFPDVHALARAPIDEVLGAWSGLGYYRRARALHEAANQIVTRFGGQLPGSLPELRSLAGIGPYTAAAIGSLAFGLPAAVVDGNVSRVVARLFAIRSALADTKTKAAIERHAARLLEKAAPGAFNEAMMDLGAVVCTPRAPTCLMCPVRAWCAGYRLGQQESLPVIQARRASPRVECTAFVAARAGRLLLARRRSPGLFGGMWEPVMCMAGADSAKRSPAIVSLGAPRWTSCGVVEHVLTHRVLVVRVFVAALPKLVSPASDELPSHYEEAAWRTQDEAATLGLSVLARKVIALGAAKLKCGWDATPRGRSKTSR